MAITYLANGLSQSDPATIQYRVGYDGATYDSPALPFDQGNPAEDPPYGLWGILNQARAGSYFQPRANTGAAFTAQWSNIVITDCSVDMGFRFDPKTLNLRSRGTWVTGYLQPPAGYAAADVDLESIRLNGIVPLAAGAPTAVGDFDGDSVDELSVKFHRAEVQAILSPGDAVVVTVSGSVGGSNFEGSDTIRVKPAHP